MKINRHNVTMFVKSTARSSRTSPYTIHSTTPVVYTTRYGHEKSRVDRVRQERTTLR
jgi:hypothetical protein